MADVGKSSTGMDGNLAALLSYVLGLITGLVFFLVEKDNAFVKFHAMQSILFSLSGAVLTIAAAIIPVIGWVALPIIQLAFFVYWIILMVKAYQGEQFRVPVLGDIAAKQAGLAS